MYITCVEDACQFILSHLKSVNKSQTTDDIIDAYECFLEHEGFTRSLRRSTTLNAEDYIRRARVALYKSNEIICIDITKFALSPKSKSKIICVDFDGTIVQHKFPDIGELIPGAIRVLKRCMKFGHRLILYTCREDTKYQPYLTEAVNFCKTYGIEFVSVNCNRPEDDFRDQNIVLSGCRKVYCDYLVDDRNIGGFIGWDKVEEYIFGDITKDEE